MAMESYIVHEMVHTGDSCTNAISRPVTAVCV